jgi:hypothetical protein
MFSELSPAKAATKDVLMTQAISSTTETAETARASTAVERRRSLFFSLLLFFSCLLILLAASIKLHINPFAPSGSNHFVYQAESLLHGRLDMPAALGSGNTTDIILVNGKHYIVYPPFPAILMLPFVAIFGLGFSDIFFTQVCSALNIVLLFWLLELLRVSGRSRRSMRQNLLLCLFFLLGTINFFLSLAARCGLRPISLLQPARWDFCCLPSSAAMCSARSAWAAPS